MTVPLLIRTTENGDEPSLKILYARAFPDEDLVVLVRRLLEEAPGVISLMALYDGRLAGHVLFTPCGVGKDPACSALLGPLAVDPALQRRGAGTVLVETGLRQIAQTGVAKALVLGAPAYYSKFGFKPETAVYPPYALRTEWQPAWQSVPISDGAESLAGTLRPPAPWLRPELWAP